MSWFGRSEDKEENVPFFIPKDSYWETRVREKLSEIDQKLENIIDKKIDSMLPDVKTEIVSELSSNFPKDVDDTPKIPELDPNDYVSKREFKVWVDWVSVTINSLISKRLTQAEIEDLKVKLSQSRGEEYKETLRKYNLLKETNITP